MRVLGIDSGISGALAVLERGTGNLLASVGTRLVDCRDMPLTAARRLDVLELRRFIVAHHPDEVVAEFASRGAKLCRAAGVVEATVRLLGIPYREVSSFRWRGDLGLKTKGGAAYKALAADLVEKLFPGDWFFFERAKDDDRCEAVLIAYWAIDRQRRMADATEENLQLRA